MLQLHRLRPPVKIASRREIPRCVVGLRHSRVRLGGEEHLIARPSVRHGARSGREDRTDGSQLGGAAVTADRAAMVRRLEGSLDDFPYLVRLLSHAVCTFECRRCVAFAEAEVTLRVVDLVCVFEDLDAGDSVIVRNRSASPVFKLDLDVRASVLPSCRRHTGSGQRGWLVLQSTVRDPRVVRLVVVDSVPRVPAGAEPRAARPTVRVVDSTPIRVRRCGTVGHPRWVRARNSRAINVALRSLHSPCHEALSVSLSRPRR